MTETIGYLSNHPKSHLQHRINQLWLRPRVNDRPFLEAGKFSKLSQLVLARFGSLFFCILLVQSRHHVFCQQLRNEQVFAQRPVLLGSKQAPMKCLQCPTFYQEQISGARSNCVSCQQSCKLFKCHISQFLKLLKSTYLCLMQSLCI